MLNRHELAGAEGNAISLHWGNEMQQAALELQEMLKKAS